MVAMRWAPSSIGASTHGDFGPRRDATDAAMASVTVRSDRPTSRGVEFIDGSLMVEPYELRRVAPTCVTRQH